MRVEAQLEGGSAQTISGQVLTAGAITAHNTFDNPGAVEPSVFNGASVTDDGFVAEIPAKSVVVLTLE
jgi:alpha-N-arabinofuranosidase